MRIEVQLAVPLDDARSLVKFLRTEIRGLRKRRARRLKEGRVFRPPAGKIDCDLWKLAWMSRVAQEAEFEVSRVEVEQARAIGESG